MLFLGVLLGGLVAWHLKLAHVSWADWRFAVARMKRTRELFWRNAGRGVLVTAAVVGALYVLTR